MTYIIKTTTLTTLTTFCRPRSNVVLVVFVVVILILLFYFHPHFLESFAIDTNNGTLRDKGLRVDHLDETEHIDALVLSGQDTEHFYFLTSIPSVTIENGNTMMRLSTDGISYLLPFSGEYQELYRLSTGIHDIVEGIVLHRHHTETEHHLMGALKIGAKLWEEHTGADDAEVSSNQHIAQRYIGVILVD